MIAYIDVLIAYATDALIAYVREHTCSLRKAKINVSNCFTQLEKFSTGRGPWKEYQKPLVSNLSLYYALVESSLVTM